MTQSLGQLLLLISNALLVPVILLLLGFFIFCLLNLGGFVAEAVSRWRRRPAFTAFVRALRRSDHRAVAIEDVPPCPGLPRRAIAEFNHAPASVDKLLDDLQLDTERLLGRLHLGIRLGPMLGLAGTLIPLGPALKALAGGDTAALAGSLIIAFSTTVVGIAIGGVCFAIHSVRQHWYTQDLSDIEFILKGGRGAKGPRGQGAE